jgi:hypothetical protein
MAGTEPTIGRLATIATIGRLGEHGRAKACIGSLEQPLLLVLCPLPFILNLLQQLL